VTRTGLDSLPPQSLWIHRIFLPSKVRSVVWGKKVGKAEGSGKKAEMKRDEDGGKTER